MSKRYIDANALMDFCSNTKDGCIDNNDIARFPAADVRENRHGYWIKRRFFDASYADRDGNVWCQCSECSAGDLQAPGVEVPFCWHCGAEMDLDYEEEDLEDEDDQ